MLVSGAQQSDSVTLCKCFFITVYYQILNRVPQLMLFFFKKLLLPLVFVSIRDQTYFHVHFSIWAFSVFCFRVSPAGCGADVCLWRHLRVFCGQQLSYCINTWALSGSYQLPFILIVVHGSFLPFQPCSCHSPRDLQSHTLVLQLRTFTVHGSTSEVHFHLFSTSILKHY